MTRTLLTLVIAVLVGSGLIWYSSQPSTQSTGQDALSPGRQAPDFSLVDYSGRTVSLADFAGRPLVINSWAAWCPFCKQELVDFARVQNEFGDQVVIIAINRAESLATARKFSDEQGITDDLIFLLDPKDSFYQAIGGFSMPETIFVDKNGQIVEHIRGPITLGQMRSKIQRLLE